MGHASVGKMGRPRKSRYQKSLVLVKKQYGVMTIVGLLLLSALLTGFYLGSLGNSKPTVADTVTTTLDERSSSIMSDLMDQTVSSCYYDLYLDPDKVNGTTTSSGDICNNAIMFYQEFCKWASLDSCNSDYFKKYIKGMEG
jgi:hypothetical protein